MGSARPLLSSPSSPSPCSPADTPGGGGVAADRYLAGRSLGLFESTGSIIATEVSALTFVGIPAISYAGDFSLIYFYLGTIPGRFLLARTVIPRIYGKELTLYAVMAKGGGATKAGRAAVSLVYAATKVLGVGVRFYAGSILISEYFGFSIFATLALITAVTFGYTLIGGLKAVVRTDLLQMGVFVGGALAAHFVIPSVAGEGWSSMMASAYEAGKVFEFNAAHLKLFFIGIVGGTLFDFCTHSFDQDYAQRLIGAKSRETAGRAIVLSSFFSVGMGLLFLPIGSLLWAYYQGRPLPAGTASDELFAHFIAAHFPPYVQGLMLMGALAATMSTIDSTINALSCVLWNDIRPDRDPSRFRSYFLKDALTISAVLLGVAALASQSDGLFVLGMKISSWSGGALCSLFFFRLARRLPRPPLDGCDGARLLRRQTSRASRSTRFSSRAPGSGTSTTERCRPRSFCTLGDAAATKIEGPPKLFGKPGGGTQTLRNGRRTVETLRNGRRAAETLRKGGGENPEFPQRLRLLRLYPIPVDPDRKHQGGQKSLFPAQGAGVRL